MTRPAPLLALLFCTLSLAMSVLVFAREYRTVYHLQGSAKDQIDALVAAMSGAAPLPRAASARSTRDLLSACARLITRAPRLRAEPHTAAAVRGACGRIAGAILADSPGHARARTVALLAGLPSLDPRALALAQQAAPHEPWLLVARLDAVALAAPGGADLAAVAGDDIARALRTPWGRDRVVALYARRPDLRAAIHRAAKAPTMPQQADLRRALRAGLAEVGR